MAHSDYEHDFERDLTDPTRCPACGKVPRQLARAGDPGIRQAGSVRPQGGRHFQVVVTDRGAEAVCVD